MKSTLRRNLYRFLLAAGLAVALPFTLLGVSSDWSKVSSLIEVSREDFLKNREIIRNQNIDVAGVDVEKNKFYLYVNAMERAQLWREELDLKDVLPGFPATHTPDENYKDAVKVARILGDFEKSYPQLASVRSFGKSVEGRDIQVLKVTHGAGVKPSILVNAMHHARELMTTEVALDMAETLLSNYGRDPQVTNWVDSYDIYIVPMLNVDGNKKVWSGEPMWRKNARGNWGVDINRNYPYGWNSCNGSSGYEMAQDYRGPAPASEPETNALMDLVATIRPVLDLSLHSFSELVLYPYGCGSHTETKDVLEPIGQALASLLPREDGMGNYRAGTPGELIYAADGGDIDWMYHEYNVLPYVIEMNSAREGFQPNYQQWRDKTVTKMRPGWRYLLERLGGPSIEGKLQDANASVLISGREYKVRPDGYFRILLNPGDYDVEIRASGRVTAQKRIKVSQKPVTILN